MINHLRVIGWMGLAFWIVVVASIFAMRLEGDGHEYLLRKVCKSQPHDGVI